MNKKSERDYKGVYGLEITTTNACNYNCSYCFERNHTLEKSILNVNIVTKRVNELLDSEWFKEKYAGIKIILWGGEPTLNMPLCIGLMKHFMYDERVCFFIYTNGSTIEHLLPTLKRLQKQPVEAHNARKITVQISYDGQPIHDMNRRDKNGNPTSMDVLHALDVLHHNNINYGLKSTISWGDFSFVPLSWDDFEHLHDIYGSNIKYAATVNYYDVKFGVNKNIVKKALIEIAQREVRFYRKHGYHLSNIFRNNKSFCATGKGMACVNTNGDVYVCHGAIYSKCSEELKYGSIFDKDFINSIQRANSFYQDNHIQPKECDECISTSCLRCNVKKFEESKKETHLDRFYDYAAQEDLCRYYQLVGKIGGAITSIIKKGD